jgi:Zn-dependent peptidase ImmA (M78 family)/predicted secreted protein
MTRRDAILEGAQAAARLHDQLGTRQAVETSAGCVDVFGAILSVGAALLFRPLDGLLGFCIRGPSIPGVVISTQRPLRIQRYTGAHELGHVVLNHTASLDGPEILARGDLVNELEIAANSFASEFLLPKWLLQMHARRHGWNRASMEQPHAVYQLSLRAAASYEATCVALERHGIIDSNARKRLLDTPRRDLKVELMNGFEVENYHPDVWMLTEADQGLTIEGQPDDLFVLRLTEHGGAGYLWDTAGLADAGFAILRDQREIPEPDKKIGAPVTRALTARHTQPTHGSFVLELTRPWERSDAPLKALHLAYDLRGKEIGMPRAVRRQMVAA